MHDILGHLDGFGRIGASEELDMEAYDLLCTIKGSALIPLRDLLGHGAQVRAQLLHLSQARADLFTAPGLSPIRHSARHAKQAEQSNSVG